MTTTPSILLIEDDIDDQEIFTSALAFIDSGIVCTLAANGYEAIMHLNGTAVLPDLIFLDLNMPMMNGVQFLREVKAAHKANRKPSNLVRSSSSPSRKSFRSWWACCTACFFRLPAKQFSNLTNACRATGTPGFP